MRPPTFRLFRLALTASVAITFPVVALAQGTVSAQGLGFPPGQLSTISLSTGGALAEFDPASPLNPAAITTPGRTLVFLHYAPEQRSVEAGSSSASSRVIRFPVIGAILPIRGGQGAVSIAASTLLDRSWATTVTIPGSDGIASVVESFQSRGAINDVRFAASHVLGSSFQLGAAAHVLTGGHQLTSTRIDLTGQDFTYEQVAQVGFNGTAFSGGAIWTPARQFSLTAAGQVGGSVRARFADSTIARATAPARAAGSLRYSGITGAILGVRAEWQGWSSLQELGSATMDARDALTVGVGADVSGPSVFGTPISLRAGYRWRELPFAALGEQPVEQGLTGGLGFALASGRVLLDLGVQRAQREVTGASESAWTGGLGLTIRP